MILSISEAAKRFKVSRSKLYRMKDSGQISFTNKRDNTTGIDLSEMVRVFGEYVSEQENKTKQDKQNHDLVTENFYLKREIEILKHHLQKSESRVDQLIISTQAQSKQLMLTQLEPEKSFWQRLWKK